MNRRAFIKLLGLGLAGFTLRPASELVGAPQAGHGGEKKWAMLVDLNACVKKGECTDCISACHRIHNVPNLHDTNHEIKWLWTAPFSDVFPEQQHATHEAAPSATPPTRAVQRYELFALPRRSFSFSFVLPHPSDPDSSSHEANA